MQVILQNLAQIPIQFWQIEAVHASNRDKKTPNVFNIQIKFLWIFQQIPGVSLCGTPLIWSSGSGWLSSDSNLFSFVWLLPLLGYLWHIFSNIFRLVNCISFSGYGSPSKSWQISDFYLARVSRLYPMFLASNILGLFGWPGPGPVTTLRCLSININGQTF